MKKRFMLLTVVAAAVLGACGNANNGNEVTSNVNTESEEVVSRDDSKFRVGGTVSDAYVDPSANPTPDPSTIKAKGYVYDIKALNYELVWSDEFDTDGKPDSSKWGYDTGASGWGNNEIQNYTAGDNVEITDGVMRITTRKEEDGSVTSTRIVTRGKGDWLYGKFEIRAKLPKGKGTWPAIWMLPTDWKYGDWPKSGEIDIMEHVGYHQDYNSSSIHTKSYNHSIGTQKTKEVHTVGISEEFHTYTLEWLPDRIITYIDGEKMFEFMPTKYKENPTKDEWPFDKPFHLLINMAWGGNWGGAMGIDESCLPTTFDIDYVRVYQSPEINALVSETR